MYQQRKIRVLQAIRQGQVGGGESHLLSLIENLDLERFEPVVLSFSPGPMIKRLEAMGIRTRVIAGKSLVNPFGRQALRDFLSQEAVDIIHAHGTRAYTQLFWIRKRLKLPLVYTIHGWSFHNDQNHLTRRLRRFGEKILTNSSDLNISVSESNRQTGQRQMSRFQAEVIHNGIDHRRFDPDLDLDDLRPQWNFGPNDILVAFIGRVNRQKQPLRLIHAFARASLRAPSLKLLIVGEGDQRDKAMALVNSLGIQSQVRFEPFRQDVPEILAATDIFVLPSIWEGLPIALLEAMAMGKAIIATAADGTSEILVHGKNGVIAVSQNLESSISDALVDLATYPDKRRVLGLAARESIDHRYTAEHMTRKIESVYLKVLEQYTFLLLGAWLLSLF